MRNCAAIECIIDKSLLGTKANLPVYVGGPANYVVLSYVLLCFIVVSVFIVYIILYFTRYFDIFEMAVEVFYGLLMEDVVGLCDIHPVNQQHQNIDYLMIALAYRLTSFDHEPAWEHYLTLE